MWRREVNGSYVETSFKGTFTPLYSDGRGVQSLSRELQKPESLFVESVKCRFGAAEVPTAPMPDVGTEEWNMSRCGLDIFWQLVLLVLGMWANLCQLVSYGKFLATVFGEDAAFTSVTSKLIYFSN